MQNKKETIKKHPLATRSGLEKFLTILFIQGDLCPCCGCGTRKINKQWIECKKCGKCIKRKG